MHLPIIKGIIGGAKKILETFAGIPILGGADIDVVIAHDYVPGFANFSNGGQHFGVDFQFIPGQVTKRDHKISLLLLQSGYGQTTEIIHFFAGFRLDIAHQNGGKLRFRLGFDQIKIQRVWHFPRWLNGRVRAQTLGLRRASGAVEVIKLRLLVFV